MLICTACNLASPVITGFLFEMLAGRGRSISQYPAFFAVFAAIYIIEPLLTRVYVRQMCAAAEKVRPPARDAAPQGSDLVLRNASLDCGDAVSGFDIQRLTLVPRNSAGTPQPDARCRINGSHPARQKTRVLSPDW